MQHQRPFIASASYLSSFIIEFWYNCLCDCKTKTSSGKTYTENEKEELIAW